jgi:hypothetical protein
VENRFPSHQMLWNVRRSGLQTVTVLQGAVCVERPLRPTLKGHVGGVLARFLWASAIFALQFRDSLNG